MIGSETSLAAALGVGFVLGLRHATDADHVAAVTALVSEHRGVARSCLLGTLWGAGHTAALLVAAIAVMAFRLTIAPAVEQALEGLVGVVLVAMGANVLLRALGGTPAHDHGHLVRDGRRPFLVGVLHGLAGSAGLMLLVLSSIPSPVSGLVYVALFGLGSTLGMLLLSGLIALPFTLTSGRSATLHLSIRLLAGAASLALGLHLLWTLS